jgi:hypothetical protein
MYFSVIKQRKIWYLRLYYRSLVRKVYWTSLKSFNSDKYSVADGFFFSHSGYSGPYSMWFVDKLEKNTTRNIPRQLPNIYDSQYTMKTSTYFQTNKIVIITHFPWYYTRCAQSTKKPLNKLGEANICVAQPVTICLLTEYPLWSEAITTQ